MGFCIGGRSTTSSGGRRSASCNRADFVFTEGADTGPHLANETERLPSDGSREWWAGTGLNRRHQDFQFSPGIAYIARTLAHLSRRGAVAAVALCNGRLHAVAAVE